MPSQSSTVPEPEAGGGAPGPAPLDALSLGFLLGILVGEGSFGGDGKQPQVTIRMHVRHRDVFLRLVELVPGSKLYGPYHHGGRHYHQWMVRGEALRRALLPTLLTHRAVLGDYAGKRFDAMCTAYGLVDGAEWGVGAITGED